MTEMPCSFTGPKIFCASQDVLTRQKSDLANLQLCISLWSWHPSEKF